MAPLTRRSFLATSGIGTGLGVLAAAGVTRDVAADTGVTAITSNFNGTPIGPGDFIWFNSVLKVQGLGADPVSIGFTGSISFTVGGLLHMVPVPSAVINFAPGVMP